MPEFTHAVVVAGIPHTNNTLYHRIRFDAGDPTAAIDLVRADGSVRRILMIRDIEADRARRHARADAVVSPADFAPEGWERGDRELETAQSVAECVAQHRVGRVAVDRTLPAIYWHHLARRGLDIACDPDLGIMERRAKDDQELAALRDAQALTEDCMRMVCERIAGAETNADGVLIDDGGPLTSERLTTAVDLWFMERGATTPHGSIVAGGAVGADPHDRGQGELRTGEPVIVDLFPHIKATKYHGDCTRCVVHGEIPDEVARMHDAVVRAQEAAIDATRAGASADAVHRAAIGIIKDAGHGAGADSGSACAMLHGTGHGIGLDVHEPPLLDTGGPDLVAGDVVTIEPGLYQRGLGGIRIEDMVAVTDDGCENFNTLPKGLTWA